MPDVSDTQTSSPLLPRLMIVMSCLSGLLLAVSQPAMAEPVAVPFQVIDAPGEFQYHLQGVCADDQGHLYWSFTTQLLRTDLSGHALQQIPVKWHHGDLCYRNQRIYVAVNFGKFNQPAGQADSWVIEYDAETFQELARFPVPEVVHGAGGIDYQPGRFIVVGGLPEGIGENYLYEYDETFNFRRRHVLASGETTKGIQTALFHNGTWWFGCYGKPTLVLRANEQLEFQGRQDFNAALGMIGVAPGQLLIARDPHKKGERCRGRLLPATVAADGTITLAGSSN